MSQAPKVLITGGSGFAGRHLVSYLSSLGLQELHITSFSNQSNIPSDDTVEGVTVTNHPVDLTNKAAVNQLFETVQPTHIYHLAAISLVGDSFSQAERIIINNTQLQLYVLEAMRQITPQARLLNIGSAQEYDVVRYPSDFPIAEDHPLGPGNPYAVSKVNQDLLALSYHYAYKLDIVRVRAFNHIGEGQTTHFAVPSFASQIAEIERTGQPGQLKVGNLDAVRDFTDVKDIVKAYEVLMSQGQAGEVYNVGSGQGYRMSTILEWLVENAKVQIDIVTDPAKVRPLDVSHIIADTTKINTLGWEPQIPLPETLGRVLAYWRTQT